jgi:hypothetical protein
MNTDKIRLIDAEDAKKSICEACKASSAHPCVYHDDCAILGAIDSTEEIAPSFAHPDSIIYEKIEDPSSVRVYAQDYINAVSIMCFELPVPLSSLKWNEDRPEQAGGDVFLWLSLDDIAKQIGDERGIITVTVEGPLDGIIYRYGNHGDEWEIVGRMCGYA